MTTLQKGVVLSESLIWYLRASKGFSIGALLVQWLELFHNLPDEIEFLWKAPLKLMTCLYAWSRYFPIFAQGVNFALSVLIHRPSPSPVLCILTYIFKAITGQLVTTCLEAILMVRVHALYGRSRLSGIFLSAVMIVGTSLEFAGSSLTIAGLQPGAAGSICIPGKTRINNLMMFSAGCALIQGTLFVMTLARVFVYKDMTGSWLHRDTSVMTLMMRDGVMVFVLLAVAVSAICAFEFARTDIVLVWHAAFSWYVTLVSITGCRVIMNMRKLASRPTHAGRADIFTSILDRDGVFSIELSYFSRSPDGFNQISRPYTSDTSSRLD